MNTIAKDKISIKFNYKDCKISKMSEEQIARNKVSYWNS